jgi:hypothetical protein
MPCIPLFKEGGMKRVAVSLLFMFILLVRSAPSQPALHAVQDEAGKAAALKVATAWLVLLDKQDTEAAAGAMAPETIALFHWPTKQENMAMIAGGLNQPPRGGLGAREMSRTFKPEATKQATSCGCGVRDGEFMVFFYDVKYTWTQNHIYQTKEGIDVLWMLLENDGTWKPVGIFFSQTSEHHGPAK